ncbi:hypothetical protein ACWDOP_33590 [Nocardia sp. NPDC003693]
MTDTPEDLRRRATRLRRGMGQLGVLESIIDAAEGPWLGIMDADGRGTAELRMHLAGRYRVSAAVTSAGKLSLVHVNDLTRRRSERVLSGKTLLRKGWTEAEPMPKQPEWLEYVVSWVENVSGEVDRRVVIEWRLLGADRRLNSLNDTIAGMRASLDEQVQVRDALAAEVADLRGELEALPPAGPEARTIAAPEPEPDAAEAVADVEANTADVPEAAAAETTEPGVSPTPSTESEPATAASSPERPESSGSDSSEDSSTHPGADHAVTAHS